MRPKIGTATYPENETYPERRPSHPGSQTCPGSCPPSPSTCSSIPPSLSSCLVLQTLICSCCHGLRSETLISCCRDFDSSCCRVVSGFCFFCCRVASGFGIEIWMVSDVLCDLHENLILTLSDLFVHETWILSDLLGARCQIC